MHERELCADVNWHVVVAQRIWGTETQRRMQDHRLLARHGALTHTRSTRLPPRMNPLGIDCTRFLVAEQGAGQLVGFGQVEPKTEGSEGAQQQWELRSLVVGRDARCAAVIAGCRACCLQIARPAMRLQLPRPAKHMQPPLEASAHTCSTLAPGCTPRGQGVPSSRRCRQRCRTQLALHLTTQLTRTARLLLAAPQGPGHRQCPRPGAAGRGAAGGGGVPGHADLHIFLLRAAGLCAGCAACVAGTGGSCGAGGEPACREAWRVVCDEVVRLGVKNQCGYASVGWLCEWRSLLGGVVVHAGR